MQSFAMPVSDQDRFIADRIGGLFDDRLGRTAILTVTTNTGNQYGFVIGDSYQERVMLCRGEHDVRDAEVSLGRLPVQNVTHVGFSRTRRSFVFLNADLRELWCSGTVTGIDELMVSAVGA